MYVQNNFIIVIARLYKNSGSIQIRLLLSIIQNQKINVHTPNRARRRTNSKNFITSLFESYSVENILEVRSLSTSLRKIQLPRGQVSCCNFKDKKRLNLAKGMGFHKKYLIRH